MKKVMLGLAAASFTALLALGGAQAQDGKSQTGMGADAGQKAAPTSATMGQKPAMGATTGMRMKKKHRRHHRHM
jgi:hypothetical protein